MYQASVRSATAGTAKTFLAFVAILSLLLSFFAVAPASVAADDGTPVPLQNGQGASAYDEGFNQPCTEDEAVPEGSALFHFILNGLDDGTTLISFEAEFDLNGDATADVTYDLSDPNVTATQNASGNYSINVITDDSAVLVDATAVVTPQDGVNPEPKLVLSHTCVQEVATGSLLILKTDGEGAPLAGATFDVTDASDVVVADDVVSDANGIVCVDDLIPGTYTVTEVAAPTGYEAVEGSATADVTAGEDCATRIGTDGAITAEEADVVLTNELILGSLLVLKTDGADPLAGATFDVTDASDLVVANDVVSDANGIVCVDGLVPGTYTVEETAPPAGYDPDPNNPKTFDVVGSDDCTTRIAAEDAPDLTFVNAEILGSITINKEVACDVCQTFTPGYYFNEGGNNAGVDFANESLASEPIEVAELTFSSVADVQENAEPGSLLRHYLALVLNVRLAEENGCDLLSNVYDGSVEALQGMTVGEILAEAEAVLNGGDSEFTAEQLHDAIDEINNNHGATDGVLTCEGTSTGAGYSFSLLDDEGAEVDSGTTDDTGTLTFSDLPLGTYTLVETDNEAGEDCSIVSVSEGGTLNEDGSITVTITEESRDVVLTVVNECEGGNGGEESGNITVVKETDEAEPAESFAFSASWDGDGFSLMGGDSEPSGDLAVGHYTVTEELTAEQIEAGWSLAEIDCGDADVEVDLTTSTVTIHLADGDDVTCTFSNEHEEQGGETGSITVNKEIECDVCETRTPGYYFNQGENNAGTAFAEESLSSDPITVGGVTFASVQDVQDNAAPGSLLRHYLALVLNVRMADGTTCDLLTAVYSGSIEALDGMTVGEILDEAEAVLNGDDSSFTEEQLHDAIDEINNASETENGALSCDTVGTAGFEFTLTDEADGEWTGTTGEDGSYTFEDLPLGVYTLEETGGPEGSDCTVVSATGTGVEFDAETGIVTITLTEENADVSVTVVNACGGQGGEEEEFGSITVAKATTDETDATFDFDFDGTSFELGSGEWETFGNLEAGTYTAAEMVDELGAEWSLDSIECVTLDGDEETGDADAVIDVEAGTADVTLAEGEDVLCVFLNAMEEQQGGELGSITIMKVATGTNGSTTSFGFTSNVTGHTSFSLNGGVSASMTDLADGTYSVTEGTTTGWRLAALTCTTGGSANLASRTATVTIAGGADVTCVFTNVVSEGTQGGGGPSPNQGGQNQGQTPREGTLGGTLPNTALDAENGVSIPAALLALLMLGGLAGAGRLAVAEARRRR